MKNFLIVDESGVRYAVSADSVVADGNGLTFFRGDNEVACFLAWAAWLELDAKPSGVTLH